MVTPYDRLDTDLGVGSKNGLTIQWLPGFDSNNAISGNPPLTISKTTGELSVNANRLGLFVFTVLVDEYRNGQHIGAVRRDYQLFVIDCPPTIPPDPTITIDKRPVSEVQFCEGKTVIFNATVNTGWSYQWQKDGQNISGATSPNITVSESGAYQLVTILKGQCAKTRRSQDLNVTVTKSHFNIKVPTSRYICGSSGVAKLEGLQANGLSHTWYYSGQPLNISSNNLDATKAGSYWAVAKDNSQGCTSISDTVNIKVALIPEATITSQRATTVICSSDSLMLSSPTNSNYTYQWMLDGKSLDGKKNNQLWAHRSGQYSVLVTDTTGCQATSTPFGLAVVNSITASFDSIPAFCGVNHSTILLYGSPSGGIFDGPGITGTHFNPRVAGVGNHLLTYKINGLYTCLNSVALRIVSVRPLPDLNLGVDREIFRGNNLRLQSNLSQGYNFKWTSLANLPDSTSPILEITPQETTNYTLTVQDSYGCQATDSITVYVQERIHIPDAFSPNSDGMNDYWELRGIESYPSAEITIFNRWGEKVFSSKGYTQPFDGHYQGSSLPAGVYAYQIKPSATQQVLQGRLVLVR